MDRSKTGGEKAVLAAQRASLEMVRAPEFDAMLSELAGHGPLSVLEIGAGDGSFAARMAALGHTVTAIDIEGSRWEAFRVFPVTHYDGVHIPLPDESIDAVVSSHVLMCVADLPGLQEDIARVLKPNGFCVHVTPTSSWRVWTAAAAPLATLRDVMLGSLPPMTNWRARFPAPLVWCLAVAAKGLANFESGMGIAGQRLSFPKEVARYSRRGWEEAFRAGGFVLERPRRGGVFYTGFFVIGVRLPLKIRAALALVLGSSSQVLRTRRLDRT